MPLRLRMKDIEEKILMERAFGEMLLADIDLNQEANPAISMSTLR